MILRPSISITSPNTARTPAWPCISRKRCCRSSRINTLTSLDLADDQDRAGGFLHHPLAHRAEQCGLQPPPPTRPHDDEIDLPHVGHLQNRLRGRPLQYLFFVRQSLLIDDGGGLPDQRLPLPPPPRPPSSAGRRGRPCRGGRAVSAPRPCSRVA